MMRHSSPAPASPDPADISVGWLARYEWLVAREAAKYAPYAPGCHDDLLQECRIALLAAAEKYDATLGFPFVAYAATAIGNAARRFLTHELRRGLRGGVNTTDNPPPRIATVAPDSGGVKPLLDLIADESEPPLVWDSGRWAKVFGCLTDTERRVVQMRLFDNLTYREVGEALGFRESRATFLYHQAIRRLRQNRRAVDGV